MNNLEFTKQNHYFSFKTRKRNQNHCPSSVLTEKDEKFKPKEKHHFSSGEIKGPADFLGSCNLLKHFEK